MVGFRADDWAFLEDFLKAVIECQTNKSEFARQSIECGMAEARRLALQKIKEKEARAERIRKMKLTQGAIISHLPAQLISQPA